MAGLTFTEVMSGSVSLNQTDPAAGQIVGGSLPFVMHGTITIDDIDQFLKDPDHRGKLEVRMDWAPFGYNIASTYGLFQLFSPSEDSRFKLMVYEWRVEHAQQSFYFSGRKEVKIHPLLCFWPDTTTLFTLLHQGQQPSDPVIGAGILKLTPGACIKMLTTLSGSKSSSFAGGVRALWLFSRFFVGVLWDVYVKKKIT